VEEVFQGPIVLSVAQPTVSKHSNAMTAATSLASSLSSSITGLMMEVALLPSSQLSDARICYEHQCRTCQSQQEETSTHNSAMIYIGSASGP